MRFTARLALILVIALVCAAFAAQALARPGAYVWKKAPNPTAKADGLWLCARGPSAAVYACGTVGWPDTTDIWLVKYKAGGGRAWSRTWNGPDALADDVAGMVADAAGNVYVAGRTRRTSGRWDSVVLKYDAGGHRKWAVTYAADAQDDETRAIGLDAAGNVYVAGVAYRSGDWDVYTARFRRTDGVRQWTSWYDGSGADEARSMAVTGGGTCYVAGQTDTIAQPQQALLVKTTSAGVFAWAKTWGGAAGKTDLWETVDLARSGGVMVAGEKDSSGPGDLVVARYTAAGQRTWLHAWSSAGSFEDYPEDAAVARDGSVWVVSLTDRGSGGMRGAVVKWSASGKRRFAHTIGSGAKPAEVHAVTLDASGNAYLAGTVKAHAGAWDPLAVKYSPAGRLRWRSTASLPGNKKDSLDDIVLGGSGYLYGCGSIGWDAANARGLVVKIRR